MNSLPSSVNYATPVPSLPENSTKYSVALQPVNGSTFAMGGNQLIFQFPNRGYLIPDSIYLRYKATITTAAADAIVACPYSTFYQRLETQIGSQIVDSINDWNQVNHILSNTTMDVAQKYGMMSGYGYLGAGSVPSLEELDGRVVAATETVALSGPVPCMLSNIQDHLLPLFAMPTISMIFTTEALANVRFGTSISAVSLFNVELCFDFVEFGSEVDAMVRGMGPKIFVKSQSFSNSSVVIPSGSNGSQSIIFNQRYASCKAAIVSFSNQAYNKKFDAIDITTNTGDYSLSVSGIQYPQKSLSALNNKSGVLQELRKTMGSIYDKTNSMSINNVEFLLTDASTPAVNSPGKFYLGFALEKLHSGALLTGISTNNSNISVNVTQSTATTVGHQCNLLLVYDALIEIDTVNKQATVRT
jgi:hypothetical protein